MHQHLSETITELAHLRSLLCLMTKRLRHTSLVGKEHLASKFDTLALTLQFFAILCENDSCGRLVIQTFLENYCLSKQIFRLITYTHTLGQLVRLKCFPPPPPIRTGPLIPSQPFSPWSMKGLSSVWISALQGHRPSGIKRLEPKHFQLIFQQTFDPPISQPPLLVSSRNHQKLLAGSYR